jgi:NADPH-dependent ferric siderophore reductase
MARTNLASTRVKPADPGLLVLEVVRRERVSPHFMRVTLGRRDAGRFVAMGFDQWFRLFIPVAGGGLERAPRKLDTVSYVRYLTIAKAERPVMRNYSVRAYRAEGADGPEIDVDFVLHGSAADGGAGPATAWAEGCAPGDVVALLDEGIGFNPPDGLTRVRLVADETGLPALAGVLASLPRDARGDAFVEVPAEEDRRALDAPEGVAVTWVCRTDPHATPGTAVHAAAEAAALPEEPFFGWVVGESALVAGVRRHWVRAGVPKRHIMFCGYWKAGRHTEPAAAPAS